MDIKVIVIAIAALVIGIIGGFAFGKTYKTSPDEKVIMQMMGNPDSQKMLIDTMMNDEETHSMIKDKIMKEENTTMDKDETNQDEKMMAEPTGEMMEDNATPTGEAGDKMMKEEDKMMEQ